MRKSAFILAALFAAASANAQFWADNVGDQLIPSAKDLADSKAAAGPFKGQQGIAGSQYNKPASNKYLFQSLAGKANGGTLTNNNTEGQVGPSGVDAPVYFPQQGIDETVDVGSVLFDYGGWLGKFQYDSGPANVSGMMMIGGFNLSSGYAVAAGYSFGWLQMYQEVTENINTGATTDGTWTLDSDGPTALYAGGTLKAGVIGSKPVVTNPTNTGNMTAGLSDPPYDPNGTTVVTVNFESVLVCFQTAVPADKTVTFDELGSLTWGLTHTFDLAEPANPNAPTGDQGVASTYVTNYMDGVIQNSGTLTTALTTFQDSETNNKAGLKYAQYLGCQGCVVQTPGPSAVIFYPLAGLPFAYRRMLKRMKRTCYTA